MTPDAEDFCREHWRPLARTLGRYVQDSELGQDLAQEALARVLDRWERVNRMRSPRGYLYRAGVNLARDELRRRRREDRLGIIEPPREDGRPHDRVDLAIDVARLLDQLTQRQRLAVSLRYLGDLSVAETATVMRCRPGTVKALCHQAAAVLRTTAGLTDKARLVATERP